MLRILFYGLLLSVPLIAIGNHIKPQVDRALIDSASMPEAEEPPMFSGRNLTDPGYQLIFQPGAISSRTAFGRASDTGFRF